MRTRTILLLVSALVSFESSASAQGMFTASIGNVFGGDTPESRSVYALAVGGGGAHGIGSELEFSDIRHFFDTEDGSRRGRILTLMPSIYVAVPVNKIRP